MDINNVEDYLRLQCRVYEDLRNGKISGKEAKELTKEADKTYKKALKDLNDMKKGGIMRKIDFFDVDCS